jgi:hypothetical protein
VDALTPLTALERLTLAFVAGFYDGYLPGSACAFSMLQQLTALELGAGGYSVTNAEQHAFAACTGLRQLRLSSASSSSPMLPLDALRRCAKDVASFLEMLNVTLHWLMVT